MIGESDASSSGFLSRWLTGVVVDVGSVISSLIGPLLCVSVTSSSAATSSYLWYLQKGGVSDRVLYVCE